MWRGAGTALAIVLLCAMAGWAADDARVCVVCHADHSGTSLSSGGHAAGVDCVSCHAERRPGRVGQRHRAISRCRDCHDAHGEAVGHPPRQKPRTARRETRNCVACHEPHGSGNADLIQPGIRTRGRLLPIDFTDAGGAVPGGFVDPAKPGKGLCEVCHTKTQFYRANGRGEPHFTEDCARCHVHTEAFEPVVDNGNCPICHGAEAALFSKPSLHSQELQCTACHAQADPTPGPGHETIPACAECHADTETHAPAGYAFPCTQCHDPHGTDNTQLVLDAIMVPQGGSRPITFDNLAGRADGSFASASQLGTGVCEICHTGTRFYRADGTGDPHFTFSCLPCHTHAGGFDPP